MTFTKKLSALASTTALTTAFMIGCGLPCPKCENGLPPTQPVQPTSPSCNADIVAATADLNNTTLSPLDTNGNPVPGATTLAAITTMINSCGLEAYDDQNPQNVTNNPQNAPAGTSFVTVYRDLKTNVSSFEQVTVKQYINIFGDPLANRVDGFDLPVTNGVVAVNSFAFDAHGDTDQGGEGYTAPLVGDADPTNPSGLVAAQKFATANTDVWNFAGVDSAFDLASGIPLGNLFGQGYASSVEAVKATPKGGATNYSPTTDQGNAIIANIQKTTGVNLNPSGNGVAVISYADYQAGNAPAILKALTGSSNGVFITKGGSYFSGTNASNGQSYPVLDTDWNNVFIVSGNQYAHISIEIDGNGHVIDSKGGQFEFTGQQTPIIPLSTTTLFTSTQANAIAKSYSVNFTNSAALEKPQFFSTPSSNIMVARNAQNTQVGVFAKDAPTGKPAYTVQVKASSLAA